MQRCISGRAATRSQASSPGGLLATAGGGGGLPAASCPGAESRVALALRSRVKPPWGVSLVGGEKALEGAAPRRGRFARGTCEGQGGSEGGSGSWAGPVGERAGRTRGQGTALHSGSAQDRRSLRAEEAAGRKTLSTACLPSLPSVGAGAVGPPACRRQPHALPPPPSDPGPGLRSLLLGSLAMRSLEGCVGEPAGWPLVRLWQQGRQRGSPGTFPGRSPDSCARLPRKGLLAHEKTERASSCLRVGPLPFGPRNPGVTSDAAEHAPPGSVGGRWKEEPKGGGAPKECRLGSCTSRGFWLASA